MKAAHSAVVAALAALAAAGCTLQQGYRSAQSWQRYECNRIVDQVERERCIGQTSMTYEDYKRQTEDHAVQR